MENIGGREVANIAVLADWGRGGAKIRKENMAF
jgi:hypothetical protein